ncbi:MAG: argininosuccinate lyase [Nitrospinota bacterium]|nr:argininosuccinate lyase [Nitrospinota bacterium]
MNKKKHTGSTRKKIRKPWGGRFSSFANSFVEGFTESVSFDYRLAEFDIEGSIAHAEMLGEKKIISRNDSRKIVQGLKSILSDILSKKFFFDPRLEDVHMNIEAALIDRIGPVGGKLHTARSRNDQVSTSLRLWLRDQIDEILNILKELRVCIVTQAEKNIEVLIPGYTHLQRAQPVFLSHHLMAYTQMFSRDYHRFSEVRKRVNVLPLGSGALAGTSHPIDRELLSKKLNFDSVSLNSIDAVSDRDFVIEFVSTASISMMHLSRLGEEIVLWASEEFDFINLPDAFATGSSLMPQKKNPDVAELVRGKSARTYGNLVSLLTMMKGLPLAYNRDMQEDKEQVFDASDTLHSSLTVTCLLLDSLTFNKEKMSKAVNESYMTATDIADAMVRRGIPFRDAHESAGKIVLYATEKEIPFNELVLKDLQKFVPHVKSSDLKEASVERSIANRNSKGGSSLTSVKRQIRLERKKLGDIL